MSTCPDKITLSMYVDNELTPSLRHNIEDHLKTCENCTKQVSQYKDIKKNLHSITVDFDKEESYKRLKVRQSYKAYKAPYGSLHDPHFVTKIVYALSSAAAIFAVFFTLIHFITNENEPTYLQTAAIHELVSDGYLLPNVNTAQIAPMQNKGVVFDEAILLASIDAHSSYVQSMQLDAKRLTEVDVFKPASLIDADQIKIILFDSPATVLHETDSFGISYPVFLLRE